MTSKQAMMTAATLLALAGCLLVMAGCATQPPAPQLQSPYLVRHVWAIAPLRNESGSAQVDGAKLADDLQRELTDASNLDVLPVNRTLEAMAALHLTRINSAAEAQVLLKTLGVDGLVVGTVTAYDPYDPPKLGMVLALYTPQHESGEAMKMHKPGAGAGQPKQVMQAATTQPAEQTPADARRSDEPPATAPASQTSGVFNGADPRVRAQLQRFAAHRGQVDDDDAWRQYRMSMDLYSQFVSYVMSFRLLEAERQRLAPPPNPSLNSPPSSP